MDGTRFDGIARLFAARRLARRRALAQGGLGLAAGLAAGLSRHAAARDATPAPAFDPAKKRTYLVEGRGCGPPIPRTAAKRPHQKCGRPDILDTCLHPGVAVGADRGLPRRVVRQPQRRQSLLLPPTCPSDGRGGRYGVSQRMPLGTGGRTGNA
jgi:hypothetical protein